VNTDPRDHLFFPDALFLAGGGWPGSDWKGGRHQIGRLAAIRLEYLAALRWNSQYYDPRLGRFLQPDPIGQAGGLNLYAYVGNDPLNATDPQGLCYPACTVGGGAIIGGVVGGGYYLFTAPHPSFAGFLANTAAGAVVGGTAGSGAGLGVLLGVGAGSNAAAQLVTAVADNNLDRYGSTTLQNAGVVLGDAAVGGLGAVGGKVAGDIAAPYISSASNSAAASLFLNSNFRSAADAAFINGIDPASQAAGAAGLGGLGNTLQDAAQGLYQNPSGSQAPPGSGGNSH